MPNRSCSLAASVPTGGFASAGRAALGRGQRPACLALALAAAACLAAAQPLAAATVQQHDVDVEIRGGSLLVEHTRLEVRLDTAADVAAWSSYGVYLDDNRELDSCDAWVRQANGRAVKVDRAGFDTINSPGSGTLHGSAKVRVIRFPGATPGAVVSVDCQVSEHPYFSGGHVALGGADAISRLRVRVHGAGAGWRWRITGPATALAMAEAPGEVTVTGADLPPAPALEDAPDRARNRAELLYAWGDGPSWAGIGEWYDGVARGLPHGRDDVRRQARDLLAESAAAAPASSGADKRRQLASILAFLRRDVRYVAVEVGIGGFRPAAPHDTLERRWGDCKAKATLLADMLAEAGIEAYPALITLALGNRIDPDFPSPFGFNHMILALPAADLVLAPGDPVAGGYLFVDPTLERGGIGWLHPAEQDQMALVLRGNRSELVRTPLLPDLNSQRLALDLAVKADGTAAGRLQLDLRGARGQTQVERLARDRPETVEADARRLIAAWFPTATVTTPRWITDTAAEVPHATLTADITLPALVALSAAADPGALAADAAGAAHWLALGGPLHTPAPGLTRNRNVPIVLSPQVDETRWHLTLPAGWCPDQSESSRATEPLGSFTQTLRCAGGTLEVERHVEIRQRWIDPEQFAALTEIALAEHRAAARRLRLDRLHG